MICMVLQFWNLLALDGSNWQRVDLFEFQRDIVVSYLLSILNYYHLNL